MLVEAFTRAYRCLHSIRLAAWRGDADDAAVFTRALVALTLRYLWLARVDDQAERVDRLRRLQLNWVRGRATYGEELDDLGYVPDDDAEAEQQRQNVAQFRTRADELERERVGTMPDDRAAPDPTS